MQDAFGLAQMEFYPRFLVMENGKLRLRNVFRVAARCSLDHLVVVLVAETCVGLTNAWILRKSNALEDGSTRVGVTFAM